MGEALVKHNSVELNAMADSDSHAFQARAVALDELVELTDARILLRAIVERARMTTRRMVHTQPTSLPSYLVNSDEL